MKYGWAYLHRQANKKALTLVHMQGSAAFTGLSETSSDADDSDIELDDHIDALERIFITGVLDELKVCFSYSNQVHVHCLLKLSFPAMKMPDR